MTGLVLFISSVQLFQRYFLRALHFSIVNFEGIGTKGTRKGFPLEVPRSNRNLYSDETAHCETSILASGHI